MRVSCQCVGGENMSLQFPVAPVDTTHTTLQEVVASSRDARHLLCCQPLQAELPARAETPLQRHTQLQETQLILWTLQQTCKVQGVSPPLSLFLSLSLFASCLSQDP